jgi:glutaminyl-peptide cyclotransferase
MNKKYLSAALLLIIVVVAAMVVFAAMHQLQNTTPNSPILYIYEIINRYPHDIGAFTQGLVYHNSSLFESTGGYGTSYLRQVNLETGEVTKERTLASEFFGEGLTIVNNSLVQLTWLENIGFIYDIETFEVIDNFTYTTQGWGLTYDGNKLIMSDGSPTLTSLDPVTYETIGQLNVTDGNESVYRINELEYINGDIYANIWQTQKIAIINPQTGHVKGWIDLTGIYQPQGSDDVLNGIAYDQQTSRLFITGKNWPNLYEIKIKPIP